MSWQNIGADADAALPGEAPRGRSAQCRRGPATRCQARDRSAPAAGLAHPRGHGTARGRMDRAVERTPPRKRKPGLRVAAAAAPLSGNGGERTAAGRHAARCSISMAAAITSALRRPIASSRSALPWPPRRASSCPTTAWRRSIASRRPSRTRSRPIAACWRRVFRHGASWSRATAPAAGWRSPAAGAAPGGRRASGSRGAVLALDRSRRDRRVAGPQRPQRPDVPWPPCRGRRADLSRRHAGHRAAGLAALWRSRRTATALHPGERQRGAARRIPRGWSRRRARPVSRSSSAPGTTCRMPGNSSRNSCPRAAPRSSEAAAFIRRVVVP